MYVFLPPFRSKCAFSLFLCHFLLIICKKIQIQRVTTGASVTPFSFDRKFVYHVPRCTTCFLKLSVIHASASWRSCKESDTIQKVRPAFSGEYSKHFATCSNPPKYIPDDGIYEIVLRISTPPHFVHIYYIPLKNASISRQNEDVRCTESGRMTPPPLNGNFVFTQKRRRR